MTTNGGLELLEKKIRHTSIQDHVIAVLALFMACGTAAAAISEAGALEIWQLIFIGLLAVGLFFAGWVFLQSGRAMRPPRESAIYRALSADSKPLAWAYMSRGKTNGLKIHFLDGSMYTLYANGADSAALLQLVMSRAPHAVFGYGVEQQKAYQRRVKEARAPA